MSHALETNKTQSSLSAPATKYYFSIIQTLGIAVVILDLEGRITHFNTAAETYSGYRSHSVLGRKLWDFLISTDDALILEQAFETLKGTGLQTEMDTTWETQDGSHRILHWSNAAVLDESAKLKWIVNVFLDITNERENELQLIRAKKELETERQVDQFLSEASYRMYTSSLIPQKRLELLATLPIPNLSDWSFAVFQGNESEGLLKAAYHWDTSKSELILKLISSTNDASLGPFILNSRSRSYHDLDRDFVDNRVNPLHADWKLLKTLGWQSFMSFPILSHHPRIRGTLLLASGTKNRTLMKNNQQLAGEFVKRVSPLLDQAFLYEDSRRAVQLRDEFISIASHELRTPLTSLQMQLQLLENQGADFMASVKGKKLIRSANQQLTRMSKLILEMLDTTNISLGKLRLEYETFDLQDLVSDVVSQMSEIASLKGTAIRIKSSTSIRGTWDRYRLEQVITNILMNAIKFGQNKPIDVRVRSSQNRARVEIQDHGTGIKTSDIQRIFERFEQVQGGSHEGLGLGLYISRQIARAHGGNIQVESQINQGSKFTIEIPIAISA